MGNLKNSKF